MEPDIDPLSQLDFTQSMATMNELVLFAAAFVHVFGLGLQNLNVVRGHFLAAFLTSFLIGIPFVLGVTMLPSANWPERIAFLLGGSFGIVTAMWAHPWLMQLKCPSLWPQSRHPPRSTTLGATHESTDRN